MADDNFTTELARLISAELYLLCGLTAAREMFAKSYFALGPSEKAAVDSTVAGMIGSNLQWMTPEGMRVHSQAQPVGFQGPSGPTPPPQPNKA